MAISLEVRCVGFIPSHIEIRETELKFCANQVLEHCAGGAVFSGSSCLEDLANRE